MCNFSLLHIIGTYLNFTYIPWKTGQMPFLCIILLEEVDPCVYMAPSDILEHDFNNFLFKHTKINYNNMIVCISVSLRMYSEYYSMSPIHTYTHVHVHTHSCVRACMCAYREIDIFIIYKYIYIYFFKVQYPLIITRDFYGVRLKCSSFLTSCCDRTPRWVVNQCWLQKMSNKKNFIREKKKQLYISCIACDMYVHVSHVLHDNARYEQNSLRKLCYYVA